MSFTSPVFLIFLTITAVVYYLIPVRFQNLFLLAASLVFYMWAVPEFGAIVILTSLFSYAAALYLDKADAKRRKPIFVGAIVLLAGLLLLFKYVDFFADTLVSLIGLFGLHAEIGHLGLAVPVGISFYTFQTIGYLSDVYTGKIRAERNIIDYLLFITFFPAIMSGPIGRGGELFPQYKKARAYSYDNMRIGLQRFLTGAFRKLVLADGVGLIVNRLYTNVQKQSGAVLVLAFLLYGLEIYCDFAGYSDMAVGVARILGIEVRENFVVPYSASDFADFWSRWHMSLTLWLRDYVYIPLGGNRKGKTRKLLNIFIVFLLSGIWHGAEIGYILWGLIHALLRITEELIPSLKYRAGESKVKRVFGVVKVYFLSSFAFMFFRLGTSESFTAIGRMFTSFNADKLISRFMKAVSLGIAETSIWYLFVLGTLLLSLTLLIVLDRRMLSTGNQNPVETFGPFGRWAICFYMEATVILYYFIVNGSGMVSFIYFGY